jgi:hypothetical protein
LPDIGTRLHFADEVARAFSFLEDAGFRLVNRDAARLQYKTDKVFVTVEWDPRSGEINVFIGRQPRNDEPRDAFSLRDLLAMQDVRVPERRMPFQVSEEGRLGPFLEKLAEDMRKYGQPALAGDRVFFRRLRAFRSAQSHAYMRDMELRRVRSEAEKAWRKRELDRVIELYTSIENDLTESERGKLDYARRHMT